MEKTNPRLKLNFRDFILFFIGSLIIVSTLLTTIFVFPNKATDENSVVEVYYKNELIKTLPLNKDYTLTLKKADYPDFVGDEVVIEIKNNGVRVEKEDSSKHLCSIQGTVTNAYEPIICLPNYIQVIISNGKPLFDGDLS